jgi:hypothetical protein
VVAGVDEEVPRVYDDVVEAMADVVECDVAPWSEEARQRAASVAVVVLLLAGAAFLSTQRGSALAVSSAVTLASVLVLGSAALSRSTHASGMPPVAMLGCVYAAVAGWLVAEGPIASGAPIACAGAGALTAGTAAFVGLARARILLLPAVTVGMSFLRRGGGPRNAHVAGPGQHCGHVPRGDRWKRLPPVGMARRGRALLLGAPGR